MAPNKKIAVFLLEDIEDIGKAGDVRDVSEGYARNYLFPQGKASLATTEVVEQSLAQQARTRAQNMQHLQALQAQADALEGSELRIAARVHEGDQLYGKISARDVATHLQKHTSLEPKPRDISLPDITELGTYDVTVKLSDDVETQIKLTVIDEEA